ncbi:hypothetical protein L227DRAFT_614542 [Lentinus tigrinus ALCF2SS1-6]|uniref:Uncharacterized protein n=1 Tax=Lentinus tigrinus ALCF2SS1-6 TaxID=1328759 RepID=A0A5C2RZC7_9APHY|nr:hypothetical protein L227DRAFT_614542 [Lentinus tigrinus ALCF2SS1-6]
MPFLPVDHSFVVIRMDPVAMVRHLNDPEALRAAEALSSQSYLVYLYEHKRLGIWGPEPWYPFDIHLIGPCLRPAHREQCITSDMCTPIYPNSDHPSGRAPVHTEPPFPFDNCYFWSGLKMQIRVCPQEEDFDWDVATRLPGRGERLLRRNEMCDGLAQAAAERARQHQPDPDPESCTSDSDLAPIHSSLQEADGSAVSPYVDDGTSSLYRDGDSAYSCSIIASTDVSSYADTITEWRRLFADPMKTPEFHPLCHLWVNIATDIKQDEIPNPIHFLEERDAVVRKHNDSYSEVPIAGPHEQCFVCQHAWFNHHADPNTLQGEHRHIALAQLFVQAGCASSFCGGFQANNPADPRSSDTLCVCGQTLAQHTQGHSTSMQGMSLYPGSNLASFSSSSSALPTTAIGPSALHGRPSMPLSLSSMTMPSVPSFAMSSMSVPLRTKVPSQPKLEVLLIPISHAPTIKHGLVPDLEVRFFQSDVETIIASLQEHNLAFTIPHDRLSGLDNPIYEVVHEHLVSHLNIHGLTLPLGPAVGSTEGESSDGQSLSFHKLPWIVLLKSRTLKTKNSKFQYKSDLNGYELTLRLLKGSQGVKHPTDKDHILLFIAPRFGDMSLPLTPFNLTSNCTCHDELHICAPFRLLKPFIVLVKIKHSDDSYFQCQDHACPPCRAQHE